MAATLPGQVPYAAVGGPSDFAVASNAALRKRKMAEMLQAQAFKPNEVGLIPGSKMSLVNPLAALLNSYVSNKLEKESDDEEAAANKAAQEGMAAHLAAMPQSVPGVESQPIEQEQVGAPPGAAPPPAPPGLAAAFGPGGMPGAGVPPKDNEFTGSGSAMAAQLLGGAPPQADPLAPPPGAVPAGPPLLPQKMDMAIPGAAPKLETDAIPGKDVTAQDLYKWGAGFNQFGKAGERMAEQVTGSAVKSMMPMSPEAAAELGLKHQETKQKMANEKEAKAQASADARYRVDENNARIREIAAQNDATRRSLHAVLGAVGGAGNTTDIGVDATNGMPVVRGKDGRRYTMDSATGKATPYNGEVIPQAQHERNVSGAMTALTEARMAEEAAKAIENPAAADAFDTIKRGKMGLGASPQQAGVSKEGQAVLAMAGRDFAEQTKKLYGASFTESEQKRAAGFTITNKDNAESAAIKARDAARFAREMAEKYGGAAAAAAARRTSGGAAPPAAAGASQGWGKVTKG